MPKAFADQVKQFALRVEQQSRDVFVNVASAVKSSITDGSPITGAPGQPVDTGTLKASWILSFNSPSSATISTNIVYAPSIEAGIILARSGQVTGETGQRLTLRSATGGFHSCALTVMSFDRLVADEVAKSRAA